MRSSRIKAHFLLDHTRKKKTNNFPFVFFQFTYLIKTLISHFIGKFMQTSMLDFTSNLKKKKELERKQTVGIRTLHTNLIIQILHFLLLLSFLVEEKKNKQLILKTGDKSFEHPNICKTI